MTLKEVNGKNTTEPEHKDEFEENYMTVYARTNSGKTNSIKCDKRQSITRTKDEIERKIQIPKDIQYLSNQGKKLNEKQKIQENNTMNEATLEMTLGLKGGMKEDETMSSAGAAAVRNLRRRHSEIGKHKSVMTSEYFKREINIASKRSDEVMESPVRKF